MAEKNPNYPCKLEMKVAKATTTKAPKEQLDCPRCKSNNTKFCYYNNYSLNQPRYFCKSCRRYWTEGGSLRNVPIGGASRKNRSKSSSTTTITTTSTSSSSDYFCSNNNKNQKLPNYPSSSQISTQIPVGLRDLNLADHDHLPKVENVNYNNFAFGFRGLSSFIPNLMPNSNNINNNGNLGINSNSQYPSSGFSLGDHVDEFKPSFGINSVDGRNLLQLPFQELNQQSVAPNEGDHQNWSEMLGGGSL